MMQLIYEPTIWTYMYMQTNIIVIRFLKMSRKPFYYYM